MFRQKSKELIRKNDILCVILNKALKEALGERGTPGNAEYIIYVAEKLIEVYKSDHLWALDFKCISVPEMFEKLIEYTSELSKSIIEDIENFIDDYDKRINELAYGLEDISGEKVVSFNLELRSPDMNKIDAEIKRLGENIRALHSQMVPTQGITWLFSCPDIIPNNINLRQERR